MTREQSIGHREPAWAWVAGGSGALGSAVVTELAGRGWHGYATGRRPGRPAPDGWSYQDLDALDAPRTMRFAKETWGRDGLDGLVVTMGGFEGSGAGIATNPGALTRMLHANAQPVWNVIMASDLCLRAGASVVLVTAWSDLARPAPRGQTAYRASKSVVTSLCESLSQEWSGRRIRVNALAPTILDTEANRRAMPESGRDGWVSVADAARVVAFLLSDEARALTGAILPIRA